MTFKTAETEVPQANVERARKIQKDMGDDFSQDGHGFRFGVILGLYRGCIGVISGLSRGYTGVIWGLYWGSYRGYLGIMEKKMETTI